MIFPSTIAFSSFLAQTTPPENKYQWLPWAISAAIILLGLVAYGWKDLVRTHWRRIWAISGVCVVESLRRRVLWVTPLAILGVIVVSQLQHPANDQDNAIRAQDAIRQTTKFCLFASGLLITVIGIILASTNLPKEIESRVIFTIVTKPTTRLEIVLGKILGFTLVSALILGIMGSFTLGYLELRSWALLNDLRAHPVPASSPNHGTAEYFLNAGLLGTRSLSWSEDPVQVYAKPPEGNEYWMTGGENHYVLLEFVLTEEERSILTGIARQGGESAQEMQLNLSFDIDQTRPPDAQQLQTLREMRAVNLKPQVQVRFLDAGYRALLPMRLTDAGPIVRLSGGPGKRYIATGSLTMASNILERAAALGRFVIQVSARTPATNFGVTARPAWLSCIVPTGIKCDRRTNLTSGIGQVQAVTPGAAPTGPVPGKYGLFAGDAISPLEFVDLKPGDRFGFQAHNGKVQGAAVTGGMTKIILLNDDAAIAGNGIVDHPPATNPFEANPAAADRTDVYLWKYVYSQIELAKDPARPVPGVFGAHPGRYGKRLTFVRKGEDGPVAVFTFHHAEVSPGPDGTVGLQVAASIEKSGDTNTNDGYAKATIEVVNRNGKSSGQIPFQTEASEVTPIPVPAEFMQGGDFDVLLRNTTRGQNLGIEGGPNGAVAVVAADRNFAFNLATSLFILWLLALLVVIIAVFCSTFVSWPIAIVLTLVILLARWGVEQLGDALNPGQSRSVPGQVFGIHNPTESFLLSSGMDKLSALLRYTAAVLPDISKFPVVEDIERGVAIPAVKVGGALSVVFCYGLPMLVFSYVILRRKEVAP
jgi:ABC-type transport system involved in multi-copper enzyme maturation permease subunit